MPAHVVFFPFRQFLLLAFAAYLVISFSLYPAGAKAFSTSSAEEPDSAVAYEDSGFIQTSSGQSLYYIARTQLDENNFNKPLLLFIHGAPERAEVWLDYMERFSDEFFTVAYNSRGYFPSSIPTGSSNYEIAKLAEDAVDVAAHFGYETFTVVGHDWGAATAWQIAMDFPEQVERLVIFSNPHPIIYSRAYYFSHEHRKLINAYIPLVRKNVAPWTREATLANDVQHFKEYVYTPAANNAIPESLHAALEETWTYDDGASIAAIYNHYKALDWPLLPFYSCNFLFFSLAVEQPVLLFYGDKDRFVSSDAFEFDFNDCNPNTQYVKFADGDHFIHHVYKEDILEEMDMFFAMQD